jgi:urease accessory protein
VHFLIDPFERGDTIGKVSGAAVADETIERSRSAAGSGTLHILRHGNRSVVSSARASSPLRLLTPSNHGNAAWVFTSTYGGGLLGGDAIQLQIDVKEDAALLLQTQASTKVYRSPRGASSTLEARVANRARLFVLPDPTVCFRGASFDQAQSVDLAPEGTVVFMDWMTAGRRASGERWGFDRYSSRLTIRCEGRTVLRDSLLLSPAEGPLPERMGRFNCVCLIVLIGLELRAHVSSACAAVARLESRRKADLLTAAAPLKGDIGCVIRLVGVSVEEVGRAARTWLHFVPGLLGDNPWARKW